MTEEIRASFAAIAAMIGDQGRILVAAHARPDGDAIGSALALGLALREAGHDVTVVNEDGLPGTYAFLDPGQVLVRSDTVSETFDLAIALDTATRERLGSATGRLFDAAAKSINIDHHVSNERYGDTVCVDSDAPATGQIVYEFLRDRGFPIPSEARDAIYVAISTDTGSFQYPSTSARTYEIGAELVKAGADVGALSSKTYDSFPFRRLLVLRELLGVLRLDSSDRVASWALTLAVKEQLSVRPEDTENLIDHLRGIAGVLVAVFFDELPGGSVRISMRSKSADADVCRICQRFGGGGHRLASGATVMGSLAGVQTQVLNRIHLVLEDGEY